MEQSYELRSRSASLGFSTKPQRKGTPSSSKISSQPLTKKEFKNITPKKSILIRRRTISSRGSGKFLMTRSKNLSHRTSANGVLTANKTTLPKNQNTSKAVFQKNSAVMEDSPSRTEVTARRKKKVSFSKELSVSDGISVTLSPHTQLEDSSFNDTVILSESVLEGEQLILEAKDKHQSEKHASSDEVPASVENVTVKGTSESLCLKRLPDTKLIPEEGAIVVLDRNSVKNHFEERLHSADCDQILALKDQDKNSEEANKSADSCEGTESDNPALCVHKVISYMDTRNVSGPKDCDSSKSSDAKSNDNTATTPADQTDVVSSAHVRSQTGNKFNVFDDVEQKLQAMFDDHNYGIRSPKGLDNNRSSPLQGDYGVSSPNINTSETLSDHNQNAQVLPEGIGTRKLNDPNSEGTTARGSSELTAQRMALLSLDPLTLPSAGESSEGFESIGDSTELSGKRNAESQEKDVALLSPGKNTYNAIKSPLKTGASIITVHQMGKNDEEVDTLNVTTCCDEEQSEKTDLHRTVQSQQIRKGSVDEEVDKAVKDAVFSDLFDTSFNVSSCEKEGTSTTESQHREKESGTRKTPSVQGTEISSKTPLKENSLKGDTLKESELQSQNLLAVLVDSPLKDNTLNEMEITPETSSTPCKARSSVTEKLSAGIRVRNFGSFKKTVSQDATLSQVTKATEGSKVTEKSNKEDGKKSGILNNASQGKGIDVSESRNTRDGWCDWHPLMRRPVPPKVTPENEKDVGTPSKKAMPVGKAKAGSVKNADISNKRAAIELHGVTGIPQKREILSLKATPDKKNAAVTPVRCSRDAMPAQVAKVAGGSKTSDSNPNKEADIRDSKKRKLVTNRVLSVEEKGGFSDDSRSLKARSSDLAVGPLAKRKRANENGTVPADGRSAGTAKSNQKRPATNGISSIGATDKDEESVNSDGDVTPGESLSIREKILPYPPPTEISNPITSKVVLINVDPSVDDLINQDLKDLLKGFCREGCLRLLNFSRLLWKFSDPLNPRKTICRPYCRHCLKTSDTSKPLFVDFWFHATFQHVGKEDTIVVLFSSWYAAKFLGISKEKYTVDDDARGRVHSELHSRIINKTPLEIVYVSVKADGNEHFRAM